MVSLVTDTWRLSQDTASREVLGCYVPMLSPYGVRLRIQPLQEVVIAHAVDGVAWTRSKSIIWMTRRIRHGILRLGLIGCIEMMGRRLVIGLVRG